jgi:hypothetical protein
MPASFVGDGKTSSPPGTSTRLTATEPTATDLKANA